MSRPDPTSLRGPRLERAPSRWPWLALACAIALGLGGARADDGAGAPPARRRSVIYFIGDGMGVSQLTLGRLGAASLGVPHHLDRLPVVGLACTRSLDRVVTDSAAAGTALASGFRTNNQVVGQTPAGEPLESLVEAARRGGWRTGVVTTTRITHATPACFLTHVVHRDREDEIAAQMVARPVADVVIGGGARHFTKDGRLEALAAAGYAVATDPAQLAAATGERLFAVLAPSHLPYAIERPAGFPSLRDLTRRAVEVLAPQGPFVLMVEGGRVDHAAHEHDAAACLRDQLDLDQAVGWALDRARDDPDLLVVVTADHATGSLGISEVARVDRLLTCTASAEQLTARRVDLGDPAAVAAFVAAVEGATGVALTPAEVERVWRAPGGYGPRTTLGHLVSARHGVEFYDLETQETRHTNTHGHDGAMVPVLASGPEAGRFAGVYANTEVPRRIARVLGVPLPGVDLPAPARGERGL